MKTSRIISVNRRHLRIVPLPTRHPQEDGIWDAARGRQLARLGLEQGSTTKHPTEGVVDWESSLISRAEMRASGDSSTFWRTCIN